MHENIQSKEPDNAAEYKTGLGIKMFILYALIYAGFVLINTINPKLMEWDILGVNLAVVYGFGLIVIALILALIYNSMCSKAEEKTT